MLCIISYLEAELRIREHVHDLVDGPRLEKRFSSVEANTQIINVPISDETTAFVYLKGSNLEMSYVISLGCVSLSYSSSYSSSHATDLYSDIFDVFVVLVGSTVRTSEIAALAMVFVSKQLT